MSIVRYVDYTNGDDAWTGEHETNDPAGTGPKQHLQAMIDALTQPVTEDCTINLAGTPSSQESYGYHDGDANSDTEIDLENFQIEGAGELIIQPGIWDNDAYEEGDNPFSGVAGDFDPKSDKPCVLPPIQIKHTKKITFRGVEISGEAANAGNDPGPGLVNQLSNDIQVHYSSVTDLTCGLVCLSRGDINVYNCYLEDNIIGAAALAAGGLGFFGDNYIENCLQYGILAVNNSVVVIRGWAANPLEFFTTRIYTTKTRRDYAAIKAMVNSTVYIGEPQLVGDYEKPVMLQIVNEKELNAPGYFGVILESKSLFSGAKNVSFRGEDSSGNVLFQDKPTVMVRQRIAVAQGEGCIITE